MADSLTAPRPHYGFLDSYRALLAFGVVLSHTTSLWFAGHVPAHLQFLQIGHPAVCGFIVLSGFVLMIPVVRAGELRGSYKEFMGRRARRILPPYYVFVALLIAYGGLQYFRHGSSNLTPSTAAVHLLMLRDLFPYIDTSAGGILWTVCLEWKLYFLFPLFAALLMKRGIPVVITAGLAVAAAWFGIVAVFFQPGDWEHTAPWFAVLFCLGMVVCKLALEKSSIKTLWVLVGAGVALLIGANNSTGSLAPLILTDLGSGFLLSAFLWFVMQNTATQKALSVKPLVFVGTYGYSIYLFHLFCLRVGLKVSRVVMPKLHLKGDLAFAGVVLICLVTVVVGCYLLYLVAERPFIRGKVKPLPKAS